MKQKKPLLITILVLVLFIGGASLLYNNLSKGNAPGGLQTPGFSNEQAGQTEQTGQTEQAGQNEQGEASSEDNTNETPSDENKNPPLPDFEVVDIHGNSHHLSDFVGKPVVLNFWASWCGPCKMEMPDFDEMYKKYGEEIHFVMVNMTDGGRETKEKASAFVEKQGYSFPVYFDTKQDAATKLGIYSLPTTFLIDKEGIPVSYAKGAINKEILEEGIQSIYP